VATVQFLSSPFAPPSSVCGRWRSFRRRRCRLRRWAAGEYLPTYLSKQVVMCVCVPGLLLGVCYTALLHRVYSKRRPASAYLTQLSLNQSQSHTTRPGTHISQKNTHCVRGSKGGCIQPRQASGNLTAATPLASKEKSVHILGIRACALRWTVRRRPLRDRPSRARGGANQPPSPRCACVTEDLVVGPSCASCVRV